MIGSGGEGRFGLQWYAPATYPKPPGLSSRKSLLSQRFQKLSVSGWTLARDLGVKTTTGRHVARGVGARLCHGNGRGIEGWNGLIGSHAAATASDHCAAASALKIRRVDREIRWR